MARRQKKYHYIYKTTCTVNKKYYIGMHSTDSLYDRYLGSGKRLWYSINYYGKDKHEKVILEFCDNREELKKREKEIVNEQLISEELCMNLQKGGGGGFIDYDHMMKVSKSGNDVFLKKMEDRNYREYFSKKLSEANKKQYEDGRREKKYFYEWKGKKHTEESKLKISESKKGKYCGEKNSVYGRKWMTKKNELPKMVKKEEIDNHILNGWVFGKKYIK